METLALARDTTSQPTSDATYPGAPQARRGEARHGVAQRLDASLVPAITGVRISPNEALARLVNISSSGALVECACRYNPGSAVTVRFTGTFQPTTVPGRVARATVSGVGPGGALSYHIGIAFIAPIALPGPATHGVAAPHAVSAASPAVLPSLPAPPSPPSPVAPPRQSLRNSW
jgi:hypothetical protein